MSSAAARVVQRGQGAGEDLEDRAVLLVALERRPDIADRLLRDRRNDRLLAREVAVDRAGREPRLGEDVLHRRGVEAVGGEAAARRVEDLAAAGLEVLGGDAGHDAEYKERTFVLTGERRCANIENDHSFSWRGHHASHRPPRHLHHRPDARARGVHVAQRPPRAARPPARRRRRAAGRARQRGLRAAHLRHRGRRAGGDHGPRGLRRPRRAHRARGHRREPRGRRRDPAGRSAGARRRPRAGHEAATRGPRRSAPSRSRSR